MNVKHVAYAMVLAALVAAPAALAEDEAEVQKPKRERPTPEQMAERIMADFDADGDGLLSKEELTQSLAARQKRVHQMHRNKDAQQAAGEEGAPKRHHERKKKKAAEDAE